MIQREADKWKHYWNENAVKIEKALEILDKLIRQRNAITNEDLKNLRIVLSEIPRKEESEKP